MTKRQLNARIKKLYKEYRAGLGAKHTHEAYAKFREEKKIVLRTLWNADPAKTATSYLSFKRMLIMNQAWRVIPFHHLISYNVDDNVNKQS